MGINFNLSPSSQQQAPFIKPLNIAGAKAQGKLESTEGVLVPKGQANIFYQAETQTQQSGEVVHQRMEALCGVAAKERVPIRQMERYVADGEKIMDSLMSGKPIAADLTNKKGAASIVWYLQARAASMKNPNDSRVGADNPGNHFVKGAFHLVDKEAWAVTRFLDECGARELGSSDFEKDLELLQGQLKANGFNEKEAGKILVKLREKHKKSTSYVRASSHFNERTQGRVHVREGSKMTADKKKAVAASLGKQKGIDFLPGDTSGGKTEERLPCDMVTLLYAPLDPLIADPEDPNYFEECFLKAEDNPFALGAILSGQTELASGAQVKGSVAHAMEWFKKVLAGQEGTVAGVRAHREDGNELEPIEKAFHQLIDGVIASRTPTEDLAAKVAEAASEMDESDSDKKSLLDKASGLFKKFKPKKTPSSDEEKNQQLVQAGRTNAALTQAASSGVGFIDIKTKSRDNAVQAEVRKLIDEGKLYKLKEFGQKNGGLLFMEAAVAILQDEDMVPSGLDPFFNEFTVACTKLHKEQGDPVKDGNSRTSMVRRGAEVVMYGNPNLEPQTGKKYERSEIQGEIGNSQTPRPKEKELQKNT